MTTSVPIMPPVTVPFTDPSMRAWLQRLATLIEQISATTGVPGGSTSNVQYNSGGAFAGNSSFTYNGTGSISVTVAAIVGGNTSGAGYVRFLENSTNGSNYVQVQAPTSLAGNLTLTLPSSSDTNTSFLTADGSGSTSWGTINALTTDSSPDSSADYVMTWDASASVHKKVLLSNIGGSGDVSEAKKRSWMGF